MKKLFYSIVVFCFVSCAASQHAGEDFYYEVTPELGYHLYSTSACTGETVAFLPANVSVYTKYPG